MICTVRLRTFFSTLLLVIVLMMSLASTGDLSALAASLTPEASAYEVDQSGQRPDGRSRIQKEAQIEKEAKKSGSLAKRIDQSVTTEDKSNFERAADNVREKLNLDEPVPQSTKDFLNSVKGE